jgi:trans-2-enoyl-CoA reductase
MNNIEAEAYDTNVYEERAKLDEINKLKVNLKEILRKDDIIENVIKSFTGEQIFLVNKNFTLIKNTFLDTFGFNNSNLTTVDIVDEITNILQRILNPQLLMK